MKNLWKEFKTLSSIVQSLIIVSILLLLGIVAMFPAAGTAIVAFITPLWMLINRDR